jgi:hypothetical protein
MAATFARSDFLACRFNGTHGKERAMQSITDNFGSAPEDTSIGDCRLVAAFAEKSLKATFGVVQHYRRYSGHGR